MDVINQNQKPDAEGGLNLLLKDHYFERFYQIKGAELTDKESWQLLEMEYFDTYEVYKYTSFPSFKTSKWRYLQNLRKPKKATLLHQKGNIVVL